MKTVGLRSKILLSIGAIVAILGVVVTLMVWTEFSRAMHEELLKRGISVANRVGSGSVDLYLTGKYERLTMLLNDIRGGEADIEYIFIVNEHDEVVASTFGARFPVALLAANRLPPGAKQAIQPVLAKDQQIMDIAVRLLDSNAGTVRLGLSGATIHRELERMILGLSAVVALTMFLGLWIAAVLVTRMLRPVGHLVATARAIGAGDLSQLLPVTTHDEIGILSSAFNQMTAALRQAREDLEQTVAERTGQLVLACEESRQLAGELANQHAILQEQSALREEVFGKVEQAKREWELSMDRLDDMIILLDGADHIKRCNRRFLEIMGLSYEQIIGHSWDDIASAHGFSDLLLADTAYDHAQIEVRHEATSSWYRFDTFPYNDVKLQISGRVITLHDYTEVKAANDALALTNAEIEKDRSALQVALDKLSDLLDQVTQKKDFSVRFHNPNLKSCREVMNCSKTECPSYDLGKVRCWQIAGTYCGGTVQGAFATKFGKCSECPTFKQATVDPIYLIGENFNNMMHILEIQHRTLEKTYTDLQGAQATILQQEKMASVGQLAAGVAHEINNPMGFIASNLGSLSKYLERLTEFIATQTAALDNPEEMPRVAEARKKLKIDYIIQDTRDLIAESLDGADRVKKIVQNLKSFSRVDQAEEQPADLNECLETTLNIIWNELKYKTTVHKEYGDLPRLKCFPQQLNQVFMNLLVNGAQAIEKQGEITIRTWAEAGAVKVAISDTGGGIPADKVQRIFEPFFTTKPVGKGTGLGLSICYDIVKKHGGEILVDSVEGSGTTFTVVLPIKE